jgi:hypothetical protein
MLGEFRNHKLERPFEPSAMRRPLRSTALVPTLESEQPSPLTYGQEHTLLSENTPVTIYFGSVMSDVDAVGAAAAQAASDPADQRRVQVDVRNWRTAQDLLGAVRAVREVKDGITVKSVFVVPTRSEWDGDWIAEALKVRQVRERVVRLVFAGGPGHIEKWVSDKRMRQPSSAIRVVALQTWTLSAVEDLLRRMEIDNQHTESLLLDGVGGFNKPIRRVIRDMGVRPTQVKLERSVEQARRDVNLRSDLGLSGTMGSWFTRMAGWVGGGEIAPLYLIEGVLQELPESDRPETARRIIEYGVLVGLLEPAPLAPGVSEEDRAYAVNPLLRGLLATAEAAA